MAMIPGVKIETQVKNVKASCSKIIDEFCELLEDVGHFGDALKGLWGII